MAAKVKKGDRVQVLTGKDAGKQGRVIAVFPKEDRVLVEGVSRVKRHEKVRPGTGRAGTSGGIVTKELPVHLSNVTLVCGNCGGKKVGFNLTEEGIKTRVCRSCGAEL
jgi:large subunit ribosomal protein L24